MAVVLLTLNGVGLGHLIRATIVGSALASVGEPPVIFAEGKYYPKGMAQFPLRVIPPLWRAPDDVTQRVTSELWSMAGISLPAVVVEDTHPNAIQLPPEVRRVLLVRPTTFEFLVELHQKHGQTYGAFLLCDAPDSPTWPYDEPQTRQVAEWPKWRSIGPIYRTPGDDDLREVRLRHGIAEDEEVCVFSMGGGGIHNHDTERRDIVRFLKLALQVADTVQTASPRARLLFVKGPYFPPRIPIPPRFEVLRDEENMPALLKIAKGAVIRAGYNTTWECLSAGTPFLPLVGTTYVEPVQDRVNKLVDLGLIPSSPGQFWCDREWRANHRRISRDIAARHPGKPDAQAAAHLILDRRSTVPGPAAKTPVNGKTIRRSAIPLTIRVDDAVCEEPAFSWLLAELAGRRLRASLEVVPYLVQFDERLLDGLDPSRQWFEVSQHGYAHVPRLSESGRRCEFFPESVSPTGEELDVMARGKRRMEEAFPRRFRGGFSAPFDALPAWLPGAWQALGGTFVSCLFQTSMPGATLPVTRAGVDIWDWAAGRGMGREQILQKLAVQFLLEGHAGIVLHPRCLRCDAERTELLSLLDYLAEGAETVALSALARGAVAIAGTSARGALLRSSFRGERKGITL